MATTARNHGSSSSSTSSRRHRSRHRHRHRHRLDPETARIAIVGTGLAGLSCAIFLEQAGFQNVVLLERDDCMDARKSSYGLTLTYNPRGILQKLGVLDKLAAADCPSRSHYLLDRDGHVLGYYGNSFNTTKNHGYGQRGNLRVPRQTVRRILIEQLRKAQIKWGHKLVNVQQNNDQDGTMRLVFANGVTSFDCDLVIGADGVYSTVLKTSCFNNNMFPPPPLRPIGIRLILGISNYYSHPLVQQRGFYTLAPQHRLFVMPYSAPNELDQLENNNNNNNNTPSTQCMWQLSFVCDKTDIFSGPQLLQEALERCRRWHQPVIQLLESTSVDNVWGTPLYDRDPQVLHDYWMASHLRKHDSSSSSQDQQCSSPAAPAVIIVGDALHAMSCFKGQGANQALLDGLCVGKWLVRANVSSAISGCWREMTQRTAPIVQASREAALYWHSPAATLQSTFQQHTFASVTDETQKKKLLDELRQRNVCCDTVDDLDESIRKVMMELGMLPPSSADDCPSTKSLLPPTTWSDDVWKAAASGDTGRLRQLSWESGRHRHWMRQLVMDMQQGHNQQTCLHVAARHNHVKTVYWLVTEAGCDCRAMDAHGRTPRDVATDNQVRKLLEKLEEKYN